MKCDGIVRFGCIMDVAILCLHHCQCDSQRVHLIVKAHA